MSSRALRLSLLSLLIAWFYPVLGVLFGSLESRTNLAHAAFVVLGLLISLFMLAWSPRSGVAWALLALAASGAAYAVANAEMASIAPVDGVGGVALVTGGSKGIGLAVAKALIGQWGFSKVWVVSRSPPPKLEGLVWIEADMGSASATDKVVAALGGDKLDLLVLNHALGAGLAWPDKNGFPRLLVLNYLSQVRLLHALEGALRKSALGRVVFVSSDGHEFANPALLANFTAPMPNPRWVFDLASYGKTKALQILYAASLAKRGWKATSVHPGLIASEIANAPNAEMFGADFSQSKVVFGVRGLEWFADVARTALSYAVALLGESNEKGAHRVIHAAIHRDIPNGAYVSHYQANPKGTVAHSLLQDQQLIERVAQQTQQAIQVLK